MCDSATLWAIAHQFSLTMAFSRQKYWTGLPFPSPGDLPNPGIEPASPVSPAPASRNFTTSTTWKAQNVSCVQPCDPMDRGLSGSECSRQEYWSELLCLSPRNLSNSGTELGSPIWQASSLSSEPPGKPRKSTYKDWKEEFHKFQVQITPLFLGSHEYSSHTLQIWCLCPFGLRNWFAN